MFPISRDPPEGGTVAAQKRTLKLNQESFQFLGIPPKGELQSQWWKTFTRWLCFQFLGIPPKGELHLRLKPWNVLVLGFQFLGIPPKGELS